MRIRDVMTPNPVAVAPSASVLTARRLMARHGIRHLPVVVGGTLVGIISDRDLRVGDKALADALTTLRSDLVSGRYRAVEAVMTRPVQTIAPGATINEAAHRMRTLKISALPVVAEGRLIGILTTDDLLATLAAVTELDDEEDGPDDEEGGGAEEEPEAAAVDEPSEQEGEEVRP